MIVHFFLIIYWGFYSTGGQMWIVQITAGVDMRLSFTEIGNI